jgi:hypothetical protein
MAIHVIVNEKPQPPEKMYHQFKIDGTTDDVERLQLNMNVTKVDGGEVALSIEELQLLLFPAPLVGCTIESMDVRDGQLILRVHRDTSALPSRETVLAHTWDVFRTRKGRAVIEVCEYAVGSDGIMSSLVDGEMKAIAH